MAKKTQGTQVYIIDPDATGGPVVLAIDCVISLDGISAPRDQLDATCLEDQARTFLAGLATPGQVTLGLNFDPATNSHERIYDLWKDGTKFDMAIGWSDGVAAPDLDTANDFDLPTTRSWILLNQVYIADVPLNFALNALVTANIPFQQSGFPTLFPKA